MKRSTDNLRMRDTAPMISLLVSALRNDTATLKKQLQQQPESHQQQTTTANNNKNNNDSHHTL